MAYCLASARLRARRLVPLGSMGVSQACPWRHALATVLQDLHVQPGLYLLQRPCVLLVSTAPEAQGRAALVLQGCMGLRQA
jgi:hypothetical protein